MHTILQQQDNMIYSDCVGLEMLKKPFCNNCVCVCVWVCGCARAVSVFGRVELICGHQEAILINKRGHTHSFLQCSPIIPLPEISAP